MDLIVPLIFIAISVIVAYIVGWLAGRKQTIQNMFETGIINADTYKEIINKPIIK